VSTNYFQDELRYLRDVGPEFARANPEIARLLGDRGSDPDVERMLEGVAFLCGRIRQKLDDDLPEITSSLMSLIWPHYLRPIPSMSILELLPELDAMQAPLTVDAGAGFASIPVDGTTCHYRSCWPVQLRPWAVEDIKLETMAASPVRLIVKLRSSAKTTLDSLELQSVRLHLAGDPAASFLLYLLLSAHVKLITISDGSSNHQRQELNWDPSHVAPAGLEHQAGVLPYPVQSFSGYRLLQEYLAFKERFLFVDVFGLDQAVTALELTDRVEIAFTFNRIFDSYPMVSRENVRLHCVPIINLFEHPADPIRAKHDRSEHLLMPSKVGVADRRHLEIYSVDEVAGLALTESPGQQRYEPFYSFRHRGHGSGEGTAYFQTHLRPNVVTNDLQFGTDTYISFVPAAEDPEIQSEETISVELTCTNRDLPSALRAGDITQQTDSSPPGTRFHNLLKPTPTVPPPLGKSLHWRLISQMALNYVSMASAERFRELLRVYDFLAEFDAQRALAQERMLEGILDVKSGYAERLLRGSSVKGTSIEITLNEDHFAGEGDAYLFGVVVDRFFALYSTINGFTQLTMRFSRSGQIYEFPPRWGEQISPAGSREAK
jgi:type VI secretion system protein ImpG